MYIADVCGGLLPYKHSSLNLNNWHNKHSTNRKSKIDLFIRYAFDCNRIM